MRFSGGSQFPAYLPEGMARCRGGSSFRFENLLAYGGCVAIESYVHNIRLSCERACPVSPLEPVVRWRQSTFSIIFFAIASK